jgi:hypothetical protein
VKRRALAMLCVLVWLPFNVAADDGDLSDEHILGARSGMRLTSLRLRLTAFDQDGHGYQSRADRAGVRKPGSEWLLVDQPQLEMVATSGRLTHRLWVPVDVVTSASADALDVIATASRHNESASFDLSSTYHVRPGSDVTLRAAVHVEEPFRSYQFGAGFAHSFADDNAVLSASVNQSTDEFDRFDIFGHRFGRTYRSSTNGNIGLSQLLSPTTVAYIGYGGTLQLGELSNTWNAVPLDDGTLGREYLPRRRGRHALLVRFAQALPWQGALHGSYRFYLDTWQIHAHTFEGNLWQHLGRAVSARLTYRYHSQNAPDFWTTDAAPGAVFRSADSDLAGLHAQTVGGGLAIDLASVGQLRRMHVDVGYERYFRSNDLRVNVYTCAVGFGF